MVDDYFFLESWGTVTLSYVQWSAEDSDNLGTSVEFLRKGVLVVDLHPRSIKSRNPNAFDQNEKTTDKRR